VPRKNRLTFWTGVEIATLYSPLSPTECAGRLRDRLDREKSGGIIGGVSARSLWLRREPGTVEAQNSWFAVLSATMAPHRDGTRIECYIGLSRMTAYVVSGFILLPWIMVAWNAGAAVVLVPFSLIVAGMHLFAGSVARRQSRSLLYFLSAMVESREGNIDREGAIEDLWRNA